MKTYLKKKFEKKIKKKLQKENIIKIKKIYLLRAS